MLYLNGVVGLVMLGFWVFCLIDVITTDESLCRNLQKTWWILIVLFLAGVGGVIWLVAGRPRASSSQNLPYRGSTGFPEYERPGRHEATTAESDEEFLRRCRERAEEQRRRYEAQRRRESESED